MNIPFIFRFSVSSPSISEGNSGQKNLTFTVSLDSAKPYAVQFDYRTIDGTATVAGNDYVATSGTKQIPAGQTSTTIDVPIIGDTTVEPDETFTLECSNGRSV